MTVGVRTWRPGSRERKECFYSHRVRESKVKVLSDAIVSHIHHRKMTKHLRMSEEELESQKEMQPLK